MVSVCGVGDAGRGDELIYRFGSAAKNELTIRSSATAANSVVDGWQTEGARGGDTTVRFRNVDYRYIVQDTWTGPMPGRSGCRRGGCGFVGVRVEKAAETVSERRCLTVHKGFERGILDRIGVREAGNGAAGHQPAP